MTKEAEEELVQWILDGQYVGTPRSRDEIKHSAWILSQANTEGRQFGENGPSNGFVGRFLKRHPNLTSRKPEGLSSAAANVTQTNLMNWFDHVEKYLRENNFMDVLDDPRRILNCDEAGFALNPVGRLVIAERNAKDVHHVLRNEKEQLTVLYTFSADGFTYNPFIVYPGVRLNKEIRNNIPDGISHTMTPSGWMTTVAFCVFLRQLAQQARSKCVPFPIVLFLDGHKSHEGLDVARVAREENIILIRFYPNATSYYQPADKGLFKPIKSLYEKFVKYNKTFNNFVPSKQNFGNILKRIHYEIKPEWVVKSFGVCGIFPFNKHAIDYSRFKTHNRLETQSNDILSEDSGISNDSITQQGLLCENHSSHEDHMSIVDVTTQPEQILFRHPTELPNVDIESNADHQRLSLDCLPLDLDHFDNEVVQLHSEHIQPDISVQIDKEPNQNDVNLIESLNVEHFGSFLAQLDSQPVQADPDAQCDVNTTQPANLDRFENNVIQSVAEPVQSDQVPPEPHQCDTIQIEKEIDHTQTFNRTREFLNIESPFQQFRATIGPEKAQKFEDPNYLTEMENEKLLYVTYHQLKEYDNKRVAPLKLPAVTKPARKGRMVKEKIHFVTTSKEYEQQVQTKIDLKNEKEKEKEERKALREINKKTKQELLLTKKKNNNAKKDTVKKNNIKKVPVKKNNVKNNNKEN